MVHFAFVRMNIEYTVCTDVHKRFIIVIGIVIIILPKLPIIVRTMRGKCDTGSSLYRFLKSNITLITHSYQLIQLETHQIAHRSNIIIHNTVRMYNEIN